MMNEGFIVGPDTLIDLLGVAKVPKEDETFNVALKAQSKAVERFQERTFPITDNPTSVFHVDHKKCEPTGDIHYSADLTLITPQEKKQRIITQYDEEFGEQLIYEVSEEEKVNEIISLSEALAGSGALIGAVGKVIEGAGQLIKNHYRKILLATSLFQLFSLVSCVAEQSGYDFVDESCSGDQTLDGPRGHVFHAPTECGNVTFQPGLEIELTNNGNLGAAEMSFNAEDRGATGVHVTGWDVHQIELDTNLPDCAIDLIAHKEIGLNAAVANALTEEGFLDHFAGLSSEGNMAIALSGPGLIDALAAHQAFQDATPEERTCITNYNPDKFPSFIFDLADGSDGIADAMADDNITRGEFCGLLKTAQAFAPFTSPEFGNIISDFQTLADYYCGE